MGVDTSMYGMIRPIDAMGAVDSGMRMRDMIDERKKKSAIQNAYKAGTQIGPDGKVTVDSNLTASALAKGGYGQEAYQAQQQAQTEQQKHMEMAVKQSQYGAQVLGAAKNQQEWELGLQQLQNNGMDASKLPSQYSPETQKMLVDSAMTLGDRLTEQWKQKDYALKDREVRVKEREAYAKSGGGAGGGVGGLTEGFKAADKDYAKDYNDFTGGGEVKAIDAITKLRDMQKIMSEDTGIIQAGGGPISGSLPDAFRTQKSIAQRDNIVSAANSALKATFGGQLSDGERKALANEFYNDRLSNAENLKIIERKIGELENGLETQRAKSGYFQQYGSLTGFKPQINEQQKQTRDRYAAGKFADRLKPKGGSMLVPAAQADFNDVPDSDIEKMFYQLGGK